MTKAENRAAAKAYHREKMRELADAIRANAAKADLAELARLHRYLIFGLQSRSVLARPLIDAIDDMAERITGDRTVLRGKSHSIDG